MKQHLWTDIQIVAALQGDRSSEEAALRMLLHDNVLQQSVRAQVRALGGGDADAGDALSVALVLFDEKVRTGQYEPVKSAVRTYIVSIARQWYFTRQRSDQRRAALHRRVFDENVADPESDVANAQFGEVLDTVLGYLGEKCRKILKLYSLDYSMAEIAESMSYKNHTIAKTETANCRKRMHKYLTENPALLKTLREQ